MLKIALMVITPLAMGAIGAAYILGAYALCKRWRLETGGPWFAAGVVGNAIDCGTSLP